MCVKVLEEGRGCAVFAGVSRSDWVFHSWLCWVEVVRGGKWATLVTEEVERQQQRPCLCSHVLTAAFTAIIRSCCHCLVMSSSHQLPPLGVPMGHKYP